MTANANVVSLVKDNSTLVRPKYSPGLLLRDDDLKAGIDYTRELSRLLFQSLFGCGVVCGLTVSARVECGKLIITVARGVALNGMGDPIYVPKDQELVLDPTCGDKIPDTLWVVLCRKEKCCAPRSTVCGCEDDDSAAVCTREQEWFEITLVKEVPDDCVCKCPEGRYVGKKTTTLDANDLNLTERQRRTLATRQAAAASQPQDCACVDPCDPCYKHHYAGDCCCEKCSDDCECCCGECVLLAVLPAAKGKGTAGKSDTLVAPVPDHSVRRFVRPVLMRDPQVLIDQGKELCPTNSTTTPASTNNNPG